MRLLSRGALVQVDRTARRILRKVGLAILDDAVLEELGRAGARVDTASRRVRMDGTWLDEVVGRAPSSFVLCSRDGRNDVELGSGKVHFGSGGRAFRIMDGVSGRVRPSVLADVADAARIVDGLDNVRFHVVACQADDLPPDHYHLVDFLVSMDNTTKHVMGGCHSLEGARQLWELAAHVAGGERELAARPFVSMITNPISPLTIEGETLDILGFCCRRGLPVTCASAPISGATAPTTLAGTLAQMHAEALAGVAIAQVLAPGSRVLYGAVAATMDMRKMEYALGSVEMAMMNAAAVQLAGMYHLPVYASAGVTESKTPDIQAGFEKCTSSLLVAMAGGDYIHLAAGMLDSGNTICLEQYVIDDEVIGMIHRLLAGVDVSEAALGLEVVERVGPGGHYMTEDHTVDHMMSEHYYPSLSVRCNLDTWEEEGRPSVLSRAGETVRSLLSGGGGGLLGPETVAGIERRFPAAGRALAGTRRRSGS